MKSIALIFAAALSLTACIGAPEPVAPTENVQETETPVVEAEADAEPSAPPVQAPPAPPSFATAIERNLPSGTVNGAETVSQFELMPSNTDFSAASDYAASMQSFAFLVWHDGALKHAEYFEPHDATLRPESASMHKSVLALAVGAAIDGGFISGTDATVETYIPEWAGEPRGQITIEQLLQMSSGLKPLSSEGGMQSENMKFLAGMNVRETLLNLELVQDPGSVFHYAGTVNQLLGLIIERTTGQPYEAFLSQKIWSPIGADTAYVWYNEPDGFPRTHTGLLAIAEDWLKVGLLIKNHGAVGGEQIIPADFIEAMTTPSPANPNYGYQTWLGTQFEAQRFYNDAKAGFGVLATAPFAVGDMVYFDGFGGQRVYISQSLDLVIVRTGEIRFDWDDAALPNMVIAALKAE